MYNFKFVITRVLVLSVRRFLDGIEISKRFSQNISIHFIYFEFCTVQSDKNTSPCTRHFDSDIYEIMR